MRENERLVASVLLVFVVYFGLNSVLLLFVQSQDALVMHYIMTLSFFGGILSGALFFIWTKPAKLKEEVNEVNSAERNIPILKRALTEDEIKLLDMIKESEGITQDSLRFRTGFSKSKVSALLLRLERNGIISREKLGKTYKVAIGEWLKK